MSKGIAVSKNATPVKSPLLKVLGSICAFTLLGSIIYMYFVSVELIGIIVSIAALGGLSAQVLVAGCEGIIDFLLNLITALVEGIIGVFVGIFAVIASIFG